MEHKQTRCLKTCNVFTGTIPPGKIPATVNMDGKSALDNSQYGDKNWEPSGKLVDSHSLIGRLPIVAQTPFPFRNSHWLAPIIIHLLCSQCQEPFSLLPLSAFFPQVKLNRMSASLRNARSQISALQGRLEGLNLLNIDNVQAMVDRRVENITGVVNKLSSSCTTQCAAQNSPQCKQSSFRILGGDYVNN